MITNIQVKMARAALGWGVRDLAKKAGVVPNTVSRFETTGGANASTVAAIERVLEKAGIQFIPENGGGVGVRFKNRG